MSGIADLARLIHLKVASRPTALPCGLKLINSIDKVVASQRRASSVAYARHGSR